MEEYDLRVRTYPDDRRFLGEGGCGCLQTVVVLEEEGRGSEVRKGVRYRRLPCTKRAPELRHFTSLEATSKGVIKHINLCVCIAWWVVVVGKIAECFRC